jgi:hypothetical protein
MNKLPSDTRAQILGLMVESMSMRAISRIRVSPTASN